MADGRTRNSWGIVGHETSHWAGIGGVGLITLGLAIGTQTRSLVFVATLCVVYAGYATAATPPQLPSRENDPPLNVGREIDPADPDPGDEVAVTLTVENTSGELIIDARFLDGVPPELHVVDGTARHSDVLRPGERTAVSYALVAQAGEFEWEPVTAVMSDPGASFQRAIELEVPDRLVCNREGAVGAAQTLPLRSLATPYPGRIETFESGEGIEFHSRREYQPQDPLRRIDWGHFAKTGEFATIEHRREQLARVMLVIDSRHPAYLVSEPTQPHAVQRSVEAASVLFEVLLDAGDQVGVTTYGPWDEDCWLTPHSGDQHRNRGRELFGTHPAFSPEPPPHELYKWFPPEREEEVRKQRVARFHNRLLPETQIVFLSPCCDDHTTSIVEWLHAYGHPVTMISPDPTTHDSSVHTLVRMERADRLIDLRGHGVRCVDWESDELFEIALSNAIRRWQA